MNGSYDLWRVALSVLIAVLAGHLALDASARVVAARGRRDAWRWRVAGALALGSGIWSMHFVGMLAFSLPVRIAYDPWITAASILIAVLVSGFAVHVASTGKLGGLRLASAGVLLGLGIAAMHYVGMAAMRMSPPIRYAPPLFGLSIAVAIAASLVALWIVSRLNGPQVAHRAWKKLGAAILMGMAISGMHYLGMAAAEFAPNAVCGVSGSSVSATTLAWIVGSVALILSAATLVVSAIDAAFAARAAHLGTLLHRADSELEHRLRELAATSTRLQDEVAARNETAEALRESESKLSAVLSSIDSVVWSIDARTHRPLYLNAAAERIYGRPIAAFHADETLFLRVVHDDDRQRVADMLPSLATTDTATITYRIVRPNGEIRCLEDRVRGVRGSDGHFERFDGVASDITERSDYETRLQFLAGHDALTGLANRAQLVDVFAAASATLPTGQHLSVVYIAFHGMREVKESYGHTFGDRLAQAVARRLLPLLEDGDLLVYMQSDEFTALLHSRDARDRAAEFAGGVRAALTDPFQIDGIELFLEAFAGISVYPQDGEDIEILLKHADAAVRRARQDNDSGICFYRPELSHKSLENVELANDLRRALVRQEFELHYQPKVDLQTGAIVGLEALIRWRHPQRGPVSPALFIPIAERSGLIVEIGEWVMAAACRQMRDWLDAGVPVVPVAVNVSVAQVGADESSLLTLVRRALATADLAPRLLEIEITESHVIADPERFVLTLQALRKLGVRVAIDDFGTGQSSLSYLKGLPVDRLKIDRSFITDLVTDPHDAAIVQTIIGLAHHLGLKVTAEGVETAAQLAFLERKGCDEVQGYLLARPAPADVTADRLRAGQLAAAASHSTHMGRRERTLLLVDEAEEILTALKAALASEPYRILTAAGGAEGLDLLARHEVDVIVSAQRMAHMTGAEFLGRAKTIYPDTVRMVLSGQTELQAIASAINQGAIYKFLSKPWDDDDLRRHIAEAFRSKELADENRRLSDELAGLNRALADVNARLQGLLVEKQEQLADHEATLAALREVLEQVPAPMIGTDTHGMIAFMNKEARQLFPAGAGLPSVEITGRLPVGLNEIGVDPALGPQGVDIAGCAFWAVSRAIGSDALAQGRLLTLLPRHLAA